MVRNFEFDILIWGASGFVGRRVAHHMAARYGSGGDLRWAIGGRYQAKLESVRSELGSAGLDIPIVTGNSHDVASLEGLAARTSGLLNSRSICQIRFRTSEGVCAYWHSLLRYDGGSTLDAEDDRRSSGRGGENRCPHRTCLWIRLDTIRHGRFFLQHKAKERHGIPCPHIKMRVQSMRGGFSGGTLATIMNWMQEGARDPSIKCVMREPYSLIPRASARDRTARKR